MRPKVSNLQLGMELSYSFPATRYQGSKYKITDWIWNAVKDIEFDTVLDAFGGTGSVAYMFKCKGKAVMYNDILRFNYQIGLALIENSGVVLDDDDVSRLLVRRNGFDYAWFVSNNFYDIYYTEDENRWIDVVVQNIGMIEDRYKKAIAYYALFQSCIIKRPYNLFHRKNLYMRMSDVDRSFGNKKTWDTSFEYFFKRFVAEANRAVFSNGRDNKAMCLDALKVEGDYDLIYVDTPYISAKGVSVDYHHFYHFLEGLVEYDAWGHEVDYNSKHRRLYPVNNDWNSKDSIAAAFDGLVSKYRDSVIVISYRSDGIPSIEEILLIIQKYKKSVVEVDAVDYQYALSKSVSKEVLLIAK